MATTVTALHNSDARPSGKWPRDLAPWFESCDLPDHLRTTILVMLRRDRQGLQLWMCITRLAVELGVCRRTVQRRIRRLEEFKVIRRIFEANTRPFPERPDYFRPSATYEAHPEAVKIRPTWKDFEGMRATHRRFRVKSATQHWRRQKSPHLLRTSGHSSLPAQEAALQAAPRSAAAPVPVGPVPPRDSLGQPSGRKSRRLTSREGPQLVAKMAELMRGHTRQQQIDGYSFNLQPDDPRYRAPMSQEKALISACMTLGITEEDAREHLKLCCWKFEDSQQEGTPVREKNVSM